MAATNGDATMEDVASKAPAGTIMPPPETRKVVEKTAGYVARHGVSFEERILKNAGTDNKMSFLMPEDAYHPYYRWRVGEIKAGRGNEISAGRENEVSFQGREVRKGPEPPEEFKFSARMPNISAQDLDVVKLTALFTAKNGRGWMTSLSQREAGNYQFDFLRPQHTLYQFFSRLVDQYQDLLTGDSTDGGRPQKKRITDLEQNVKDRFQVLDRAKKRAEWVRHQEAQKVAKEEQAEKERVEYAQIDWHDFVVVETVVFDERDEATELPAPTTINDLQSASLEQKAAMSIDPNRRLGEAFPTFSDYDQFYPQQQQPQAYPQPPTPHQPAPPVQMPPPQQAYNPSPSPAAPTQPYQPSPNPETNRASTLQADRDRARAAQEAARANPSPANMKIRSDYIPRAQLQKNKNPANTSICPNCGQSIPNEGFSEHLRIEMLAPEWREQAAKAAQRSSTTNLSNQGVAENLKRLASARGDVFDPVTGRGGDEAAKRQRQEAEAQVQAQGNGMQGEQPATDVSEQIRQLHQRFAGQDGQGQR